MVALIIYFFYARLPTARRKFDGVAWARRPCARRRWDDAATCGGSGTRVSCPYCARAR